MPTRCATNECDALEAMLRIQDDAHDLLERLDLSGHFEAAAFMSSAVDAIGKAVSDQHRTVQDVVLPDLV